MNATEMLFLRSVAPAAMATMKATGIPASVTIAQAILESGWGNTRLAVMAHNYFGIKAAADAAPDAYMRFPTWEYDLGKRVMVDADFAKYPSVEECFAAHARLLATAPRYALCMAAKDDAAKFCEQLQACGYSTSPHYASQLMELIQEFDLTQYDAEPASATAQTNA